MVHSTAVGLTLGLMAGVMEQRTATAQDAFMMGDPPPEMGDPAAPPPPTTPPPPGVHPLAPRDRALSGYTSHPRAASDTTASIPENTIQLFKDANFKDNFAAIDNVTGQPPGGARSLPNGLNDDMSSLRWNLPPGVLVMFYEDASAKGEQMAIWGKGEMSSISKLDFNDKASSWAWYYVGGNTGASEDVQRGSTVWPHGIDTTAASITGDSLQMFKNKNFKGDMLPVSDVTAQPAGQMNKLPMGMNDKITALRWSLPPGVVVMLYQEGNGEKQQAAIWGQGEVKDVDVWDLNDKISRWSWYYIGANSASDDSPRVRPSEPGAMTGSDKDSIALVSKAIVANTPGITENDLRARKNPIGDGTFVYVNRALPEGADQHAIWLVVDSKAYSITPAARTITPRLATPMEASDTAWAKTKISKTHAEEDAMKVLFPSS